MVNLSVKILTSLFKGLNPGPGRIITGEKQPQNFHLLDPTWQ